MFDPISIAAGAGSALVGGVFNLFGANNEANAQKDAAQIQANAQLQAAQMQQDRYNQTRGDLAGYRQAGEGATQGLVNMTNKPFNFQFSQQDPSYQFRLQQGLAGQNASAAARGGYFSGATGQALQNYGQQAASQEYGNEFNRALMTRQNNYGELSSLAGLGESAAAQTGAFGMQAATNQGNAMIGAGQAQAGGVLGAANAQNNGLQAISGAITGGLGNLSQYMLGGGINMQNQNNMMNGVNASQNQNNQMMNDFQTPQLGYQSNYNRYYGQ